MFPCWCLFFVGLTDITWVCLLGHVTKLLFTPKISALGFANEIGAEPILTT